jgi:hypothetical protein
LEEDREGGGRGAEGRGEENENKTQITKIRHEEKDITATTSELNGS